MRPLQEFTARQITSATDKRTKRYSKGQHPDFVSEYRTEYLGITDDFTVIFETPSRHKKRLNLFYVQWLKLLDYETDPNYTIKERMRLALAGDIQCHCNCEAERYFYSYIMTQLEFRDYKDEDRPPDIMNPKQDGTVCKHVLVALQALPFNLNKIMEDLQRKSFLKRDLPYGKYAGMSHSRGHD